MDYLILVLIFCIVVGAALKLSFWNYKWVLAFSVLSSVFVLLCREYVVKQSKTELLAYLQDSAIVQDMAVLITLEAIVYILYCFNSLKCIYYATATKGSRLLIIYPSLLLFPVLYYVQAMLVFSYPGVSFDKLSYGLAVAVLLGLPALSKLFHYLCTSKEQRLEVTFLVSLLIGILGLLTTIDSTVIYTHERKSSIDIGAWAMMLLVLLVVAALSYVMNRLKWNIKHKRYK